MEEDEDHKLLVLSTMATGHIYALFFLIVGMLHFFAVDSWLSSRVELSSQQQQQSSGFLVVY